MLPKVQVVGLGGSSASPSRSSQDSPTPLVRRLPAGALRRKEGLCVWQSVQKSFLVALWWVQGRSPPDDLK